MPQSQIKPIILKDEEAWSDYRCGKITASDIYKLIGKPKEKDKSFTVSGETYLLENVGEILTGQPKKLENIKSLDWGKKWEPEAANHLKNMGHVFEYYGGDNHIFFPYNKYSGASPDGLSEIHVYEIKCPSTRSEHARNLIGSYSDNPLDFMRKERFQYLCQIYFNMLCTGRKLAYFCSFDIRVIYPEHRMAIIEIQPNLDELSWMVDRVELAGEVMKGYLRLLNIM